MKVLLLCVLLLLPVSAWAIPVAGSYTFTGPNISGGFTSTGESLSAWSFASDLFAATQGLQAPVAWSSATDPWTYLNDSRYLMTANALPTPASSDGYWSLVVWPEDRAVQIAAFRIDPLCCDEMYNTVPTIAFAAVSSVPEPNTLWLLGVGFVGLLLFVRRLQSRRDPA